MSTRHNFSAAAMRQSQENSPRKSILDQILSAETLHVQPPFQTGDYEVHVFKAQNKKEARATADDVMFASPLPVFGGLAHDDMDAYKGPEERATDALYSARHSGRDVCVVVYDLDTRVGPIHSQSTGAPEDKVFHVGAYETHVHYPRGCRSKSLKAETVNLQDVTGMTGAEDHEADNVMDADDRVYKAQSLFAAAPKDGRALAVAFFVGVWGRDELLTAGSVAQQVNKLAGTPSLEERLAELANEQSKPKAAPWYKRLLGTQP